MQAGEVSTITPLHKLEDDSTRNLSTSFQLRRARKLQLDKHFSVKEHLKPSFIDSAADLNHIRVRRGPDVAFS